MNDKVIIKPTVGRVVLFYPSSRTGDAGFACPQAGEPLAAVIAKVWSDSCVNLAVFDANGVAHSRTSVLLVQDGQERPGSYYCEWMPYQKGQAAKTDALKAQIESKAHADGIGMNFGSAVAALKAGSKVARAGWNGKGMFVYLVPAASYPVQTGAAKSYFGDGSMVPYNAYLALKGVDDTVSTWAPSGSDALAEDWGIVE